MLENENVTFCECVEKVRVCTKSELVRNRSAFTNSA